MYHPSPFVRAIKDISYRYVGRLIGVVLLITLCLTTLAFFMSILGSALSIIFTVVGLITLQTFVMAWWIPLAGILWLPMAYEIFEYFEGKRWNAAWDAIGEFFQ